MGKKIGEPLSKEPLTAEDARAQQEVLYAAEGKETTGTKEVDETKMYGEMRATFGAASFAELQAIEQAKEVEEMAEYFPALVSNILNRPDIEDKGEAIRALGVEFVGITNEKMAAKEASKETDTKEEDDDEKAVWSTAFVNTLPDSSFLYIQPGGKKDAEGKTTPRNYRHFPYKDASGKVDLPHLRNAIARIPQSNAPGLNKAAVQKRAQTILANMQKSIDEESLFNRLLDKAKDALGIKDKDEKANDIFFWKDADTGQYKCILAYSNNFRDNDNPPEIITSESHKGFDEALNKGEWPMPELWMWHIDYPVGQVDFHAYDEDSGFSVAAATFDKDKSWAAEALMESDWDALSHGMPKKEIVRDKEDDSLIVRHRTKEISFLPRWAAANKLTFHLISKEITMEDQQKGWAEKRNHFVSLIGEEKTAELEGALAGKSAEAKEGGVEHKEAEGQPEATAKAEAPEEQPLTRKELAEALTFVLDEIKSLKASVQQKAEEKEEPQDLVAMLRAHSAIGAAETHVDGRTKEAKDGPAETVENKDKPPAVTGVGLLDQLIANKQEYAVKSGLNMGKLPPELLAMIAQSQQEAQQ